MYQNCVNISISGGMGLFGPCLCWTGLAAGHCDQGGSRAVIVPDLACPIEQNREIKTGWQQNGTGAQHTSGGWEAVAFGFIERGVTAHDCRAPVVAVGHYDFGQIDGTQCGVEGVDMFARPIAGQFQVAAVDDFCAAGSEQVAEFFQGGTPLVAAAWSPLVEGH